MNQILKYDFKITGQKRDLDLSCLSEQFTIVSSENEFRVSDFYFFLNLKKEESFFEIKKILLTPDNAPYWQTENALNFLEAKFRFRKKEEVERAIKELQKALNGNTHCIDIFDHSWRIFHRQFVEWYRNELSPFLENEIKSYEHFVNIKSRYE